MSTRPRPEIYSFPAIGFAGGGLSSAMGPPGIYRLNAEAKIGLLIRMFNVVTALIKEERAGLPNRETNEIAYKVEDWFLQELTTQSDQLSIIGLYRIVELETKHMLERALGNPRIVTDLYRWKHLKKELLRIFALDLEQVRNYGVIDELRCLSNDIKHSGVVEKSWRSFPAGRKDER